MTMPVRRRELHTRVSDPVHAQICRYATAHQLTVYAAAERLILVALDALAATETTDNTVRDTLAQLVAKAEIVSAVADRALYGAMIGYAYARSAALRGAAPDERAERDKELVSAGEAAYRRQLDKITEGH